MKITKGTHVDIAPGTLVKDYEPTYKWIELIEESYILPYIKKNWTVESRDIQS